MPEAQSKFSIKVPSFFLLPSPFPRHTQPARTNICGWLCKQVAVRVRPLLGHDRKQEVCVSASGGENGKCYLVSPTSTGRGACCIPTVEGWKRPLLFLCCPYRYRAVFGLHFSLRFWRGFPITLKHQCRFLCMSACSCVPRSGDVLRSREAVSGRPARLSPRKPHARAAVRL